MERARTLLKAHHAPAGGEDVDGKHYSGGQFAPGDETSGSKGGGAGKNLRNYSVPNLPPSLLAAIEKKATPIRADCHHLQEKHPEYFETPEDVRAFLDQTFSRPDIAYVAHAGPGFISIVRRGPSNHHAVVNFTSRSGQYRVTHATLIPDHQLAHHLGNQEVLWTRN